MDRITKNLTKLNRISLPITILIASLIIGGFYYASEVNKQKSIERQQLKEQQAQDEAKQALDTCLTSADTDYSDYWYRECKSEGKLTDRCISLHDMTFNEYAKQNNIPSLPLPSGAFSSIDIGAKDNQVYNPKAMGDFYKEKNDCGDCNLPFANGDRVTKSLQDAKAECFKQYPQK